MFQTCKRISYTPLIYLGVLRNKITFCYPMSWPILPLKNTDVIGIHIWNIDPDTTVSQIARGMHLLMHWWFWTQLCLDMCSETLGKIIGLVKNQNFVLFTVNLSFVTWIITQHNMDHNTDHTNHKNMQANATMHLNF